MVNPPVAPGVAGTWIEDALIVASFAGMVGFVVAVVWYQRRLADKAEKEMTKANERSEQLLLNILPPDIAVRLRAGEYPIADEKPEVTVLFADIVGSTAISEQLSAADLVTTLDGLFSSFDDIVEVHGLEKIKTVGDKLPPFGGGAYEVWLAHRSRHGGCDREAEIQLRLWGDTVNTASRMESTSETDMIQVSQQVYERLKDRYELRGRGNITVRGKTEMATYVLISNRL